MDLGARGGLRQDLRSSTHVGRGIRESYFSRIKDILRPLFEPLRSETGSLDREWSIDLLNYLTSVTQIT